MPFCQVPSDDDLLGCYESLDRLIDDFTPGNYRPTQDQAAQLVRCAALAAVRWAELRQPHSVATVESLYDDESTRKKHEVLSKMEIIYDDARNDTDLFWTETLERFLQFGKKYRIRIEEIGDA